MRRAMRPLCVGRTMRTAISASRRAKSSLRLVSASSIAMPGCSAWNAARIGGSTSQPTTSLAVTRTYAAVGRRLAGCGARQRRRGRRHRFGVRCQGERRRCRRKAAGRAREQSRSQRRLQRVDVASDRRLREAEPPRRADRLPSRVTSTKVRSSSQWGGRGGSYENV